ncbi:MAG: sodium-dependent transporter [Sedimentisphaerales bacterium]|nr:sodium-dependent transporter [Sedimentisphaerales bacterium]
MSDATNGRENWGSRSGFILAAIGSAVGLGNVWRFPHECYSNGGSAFLIPYIIAMIVIGIPLLIMEFSLGHLTQQAAPNAFGRVGRRWEFVGWWPIVLSFIIVTYYAAVLAWCLSYLLYSFTDPLPWAGDAKGFFFNEFLQDTESHRLGGVRWPILLSLAVIWTGMFLCIFKGVRLVSKIVLWTVPIPWLMLVILTVRGLTLEGAVQGLEYYLEPNWSVLKEPHVWRAAFGQVFFSMTIAFGVMVTYASFLHRKSDLNNNALIIGLADLATSFIAGIAVFSTLGAMAFSRGEPVHEVLESTKSVGLAFVAFPKALAALPLSNVFSVIFFVALLLLGIDSAFSITEAALASMMDKTGRKRTSILLLLSLAGFGVGLLFTTRGGLTWLDTVDGFVNEGTWGIMFVGLVECLVLGWAFDVGKLRRHANKHSDWKLGRWWDWSIRLIIPVILAALVAWSLIGDIRGPSLRFDAAELKDPSLLAARLRRSDDPLSEYLRQGAGRQTLDQLNAYDDPNQPIPKGLKTALVDELNKAIEGPCLYEPGRFKRVRLSDDTLALLDPKAQGQDRLRINRYLLQDAFPAELKATANVGGFLIDARGRLIGKNVLGMCLMGMVFLVAVILGLWRPRRTGQIVEFDS